AEPLIPVGGSAGCARSPAAAAANDPRVPPPAGGPLGYGLLGHPSTTQDLADMTVARGRLASLAAALLAGLLGLAACSSQDAPPTPAPAAVGSAQPPVPAPAGAGSSSAPADPTAQLTLSAVGDVIMGNAPSGLPPNNGHGFFDPVAASLHS